MIRLITASLFVLLLISSCSESSSTPPDDQPLTLEGTWSVRQFQTDSRGFNEILNAPTDITSQLKIDEDKYRETGQILSTVFVDSGTVVDEGDSLRFFSRVYHRYFSGKLKADYLSLNKYFTLDFYGVAAYVKTGGTDSK